MARDAALALPVCDQARLAAHRPDSRHQAALGQERRIPLLDRRRDRAIRGIPRDRLKATAGARAVALHRAAAQRCRAHGRQHIRETSDGPALYVKQQKTGVELLIPIYPELQTILGLRRALVTPSQQNVRAAVSEAQIKILMDEAINLHSNELEASRDWQAVVDRTGAIVRWLLRWCDFGFRRSCTILNRMEGQLRRGGERDASELLEIR